MYTQTTYQDWIAESDRVKLVQTVISQYKASEAFRSALEADAYFFAENIEVSRKTILRAGVVTKEEKDEFGTTKTKSLMPKEVVGNRVYSNFFFRFVTQQNQFLLGNGVTLEDAEQKKRLGVGFDKALEQAGENALRHGVCWGFWNLDHLEVLPAVDGPLSGFVALLDERTGAPGVGIQFWQIASSRPMYARVFETDGVTEYKTAETKLVEVAPKRGYKQRIIRDAAGAYLAGEENYSALPIVPLYANGAKRSELSWAIKSKIDLYDRILSDFGDNLDRANDVYWVLNNFGGSTSQILEVLEQIEKIKAVANISDGTGQSSTAEPHTLEVPYAARQTALQLLEKALYQDAMALSMDELTGGSLTNVAIETAMTNLNLKCDRYEWQVFRFVQKILALVGIQTEQISFHRQEIANKSEMVADLYVMRGDIDQETALKLNPYIDQEAIPAIIAGSREDSGHWDPEDGEAQ